MGLKAGHLQTKRVSDSTEHILHLMSHGKSTKQTKIFMAISTESLRYFAPEGSSQCGGENQNW